MFRKCATRAGTLKATGTGRGPRSGCPWPRIIIYPHPKRLGVSGDSPVIPALPE